MIQKIGQTLDHIAQIKKYIGRSGCAACDRNEAAYQLNNLNQRIEELDATLSILRTCAP